MNSALNLSTLTDVELLSSLCVAGDDTEFYNEFVNRFYDDVHEECQLLCKKRKLDGQIGSEIASNTFERVRKYKSFRQSADHSANGRKAILVYLYRYVRNQFNDYHNKSKREDVVHDSYFEKIAGAAQDSIVVSDLDRKRGLTEQILKKLNDKEKRVLFTDMEYKRHQKYLPDEVLDELANELGVKKETIRKIRERVIQKINKAIEEINKN